MLQDDEIQKIWAPIEKAFQEMSKAIIDFWTVNAELFGTVIELLEEQNEPSDVADHN